MMMGNFFFINVGFYTNYLYFDVYGRVYKPWEMAKPSREENFNGQKVHSVIPILT